jgi:hypothetical protein
MQNTYLFAILADWRSGSDVPKQQFGLALTKMTVRIPLKRAFVIWPFASGEWDACSRQKK